MQIWSGEAASSTEKRGKHDGRRESLSLGNAAQTALEKWNG